MIDFFLSMSGGHPRTLEMLKYALKHLQESVAAVMYAWQSSLEGFITDGVPDKVVMLLIAKAIFKQKVSLHSTIENFPVEQLAKRAVIINPVRPTNGAEFVPVISPLFLRLWSTHRDLENANSIVDQVKWRVFRLVQLGEDLNHISFEEFNAVFEELRCWAWGKLFPAKSHVRLRDWFNDGDYVRGENEIFVSPPRLPPNKQMQVKKSYLRELTGDIQHTILARKNQPGVDVLQPLGSLLACFEVKWSEPAEKTATSVSVNTDVKKKSVLFAREVEQSKAKLDGKEINTKFCVFVLFAHRDKLSETKSYSDSLKQTHEDLDVQRSYASQSFPIIVFDRERLKKRYGPTFSRLCGFVLNHCQRHHL